MRLGVGALEDDGAKRKSGKHNVSMATSERQLLPAPSHWTNLISGNKTQYTLAQKGGNKTQKFDPCKNIKSFDFPGAPLQNVSRYKKNPLACIVSILALHKLHLAIEKVWTNCYVLPAPS